jgi:hypothetical protein
MKMKTTVSVAYSVILVMDQTIGVIPEAMNGGVIAATPSCIAVGTASEIDGQVEIELMDEPLEFDVELRCVSETTLRTPNREVAVCSVHHETLLAISVERDISRIQVWVNHPSEPDRIVVAVRPASYP